MKYKYPVKLHKEERSILNRLTLQGKIAVRKLNRVKILLLADENHVNGGISDKEIAEKLDIGTATVERVRHNYVEKGLKVTLEEQARTGRPLVISGEERAKITALACSTTPAGHARWTLRLLAEKVVELEYIDNISHITVREILKKTI